MGTGRPVPSHLPQEDTEVFPDQLTDITSLDPDWMDEPPQPALHVEEQQVYSPGGLKVPSPV